MIVFKEITKDYTKMALGTKIDRGEIRLCPCGTHALYTETNGMAFYTHNQYVGVELEDANPVPLVGWVECPNSKNPKSAEPK